MNISMKNGIVTINGEAFIGRNIQINNEKVVVDGVVQSTQLTGDVSVTISGDVESLHAKACKVQVGGNVERLDAYGSSVSMSGKLGSVGAVGCSIKDVVTEK
jgi:hypothetical protein